jgi:hypothetical protein
VAARLAEAYPPELAHLTAFEPGNACDLHAKLKALLLLPSQERRALGRAARKVTVQRWSWSGVARRLLDPPTAGW